MHNEPNCLNFHMLQKRNFNAMVEKNIQWSNKEIIKFPHISLYVQWTMVLSLLMVTIGCILDAHFHLKFW